MSRLLRRIRPLLTAAAGLLAPALLTPASAQRPGPEASAVDAEERRERTTMERFLALLEKAPRRGTALDRVYGDHVERGTLDADRVLPLAHDVLHAARAAH